ncbi:hypothetical protein FRX31_023826, partial [Thalictrum thalictroides]
MAHWRAQATGVERCYERVEGKSFEVEWWGSVPTWDKVNLIERSNGKVFQCKTSIAGGRWIGKLLCQLSMGTSEIGVVFRYTDDRISKIATMKENTRGLYLHVQCFVAGEGAKKRILCFPAGSTLKGWADLGTKIRQLLNAPHQGMQQFIPERQCFPPILMKQGMK